ncbi:hypothetical protein SAMD00079811_82350 (plasmid) [Scytonema sp. HK-05]|nr:hypothetical protein SAMD00079811_82350 [Scytonema sp. HK-05]
MPLKAHPETGIRKPEKTRKLVRTSPEAFPGVLVSQPETGSLPG